MPTATNKHTTPTRRGALGFTAAAIVAGLTAPVLAKGPGSTRTPGPDAALISLCNQLVATETERYLLAEHDDYAPDFGPNNARHEHLDDNAQRLIDLFRDCSPATTQEGHAAVARAALTWVDLDLEGNIQCSDFGDDVMVLLAEGLAPDFVWPPRPGSCSTAHWAPPTSPAEAAEHRAAYDAEMARISAEGKAKRAAEQAERDRLNMPAMMTDDDLRGQLKAALAFRTRAEQIAAELSTEMTRRGLA